MTVRDNSLAAYYSESLGRTISSSQARVIEVLDVLGPHTRQELCKEVGKPINAVTPRVKELIDARIIRERGDHKIVHGRRQAILEMCR